MSGLHHKLDNVKDSIASLFKKRRSGGGGRGGGGGGDGGGGGGKSSNGRISTPQNVKRVMHITFDSGRQSFSGIPAHWQQYFGPTPPQTSPGPTTSSAIVESPAVAPPSEVESPRTRPEPAAAEVATTPMPTTTDESAPPPPPTPVTSADEASAEAAAADRASAPPRELLSLVYDRDAGQFVNLPPHWEERLKRNNLLAPEFQTNPDLLPLVFSLMDEELRSMRAEGSRVESCLYSSRSLPAPSRRREPLPQPQPQPAYVFRIEADKSNSSSELDLADRAAADDSSDYQQQPALRSPAGKEATVTSRGSSYVTVKAVELPETIIDTRL